MVKAKVTSTLGDNCKFCVLTSSSQVRLFGEIVSFSSLSVILAYSHSTLNTDHPCCLQQLLCAGGKIILHSLFLFCMFEQKE